MAVQGDDGRLLLFDLAGVLLEFPGIGGLKSLLREPLSESEVLQRWLATDVLPRFELGLLSPDEFAAAVVSEMPLSVTAPEFLTHYESWTQQLFPGARELLDELRPRFRLAALSNSNALHWSRYRDLGIETLFERAFASFEVGVRKPDRQIYEHALRELAVRPEDVLFFDDSAANVEAAASLGMAAYRVVGVEAVRACLSELGIVAAS
jgi:putative hydrolase of the HAD superfamily